MLKTVVPQTKCQICYSDASIFNSVTKAFNGKSTMCQRCYHVKIPTLLTNYLIGLMNVGEIRMSNFKFKELARYLKHIQIPSFKGPTIQHIAEIRKKI